MSSATIRPPSRAREWGNDKVLSTVDAPAHSQPGLVQSDHPHLDPRDTDRPMLGMHRQPMRLHVLAPVLTARPR
jgi:hypothetical protein